MNLVEDKLDRSNYVKFLCNLISNCYKYKRVSDSQTFTIAIDSPWGTGKTTLLGYLSNELNHTTDKKYKVVTYNAWEHDFTNNAFEPLMYSLLKSDFFDLYREECNIVSIIIALGQFFKSITYDGANYIGLGNSCQAALDFTKTCVKAKDKENVKLDKQCSDYLMQYGMVAEFKDALIKCRVNETETLVVIIDELDRCRPKFAIDTLEIVKHFFNIPNLVFVFAIDMKQLGYSMETVYGSRMDTSGYLCRFFDYITRIPEPSLYEYISEALGNCIVEKEIVNPLNADEVISAKKAVVDYFLFLKQDLNLSLRDIDTLVQNYKILLDTVLKGESQVGQLLIYLFLLSLKYKMPYIYGTLLSDASEKEKNDIYSNSKIKDAKSASYPYIKDTIAGIKSDKIMVLKKHFIHRNGVRNMEFLFDSFSYKDGILIVLENNFARNIKLEHEYSIDGILFKNDLEKWEKIKTLTYSRYISQQLENFNFISEVK